MKNIYFTIFGLAFLGFAEAQQNHDRYNFGLFDPVSYDGPIHEFRPASKIGNDRAVIWSEDFTATGLTTTNGLWVVSGTDGAFWSVAQETVSSNGYPLQMTDQHLYWDSFTPITEAEFATTPSEGSITSPTIDLSGSVGALLTFELNAMFCCNEEPWSYNISNDNGATWSANIPLELGLSRNDLSNSVAMPMIYEAVITPYLSATVSENADCKIKLNWIGTDPTLAGQYSSHYYIAIDNLSISDLPDDDITNKKMWLSDVTTRLQYENTSAPAAQMGMLTVASQVKNLGVNTPTNPQLIVTVFDNAMAIVAGPVTGGTLANGALASGATDTLVFETAIDLSAYAVGTYTVQTVITGNDDVSSNDTLFRTFQVTETSWSHINFEAPFTTKTSQFSATSQTGALFSSLSAVDLRGVDLYLISSANERTTTFDTPITIYVTNLTSGETIGTFEYTLTSNMANKWFTFNFYNAEFSNGQIPVTLEPTDLYVITFETLGGNTLLYRGHIEDGDFSGRFSSSTSDDWFWAGHEPYLRLNMDQALTNDENILESFNIGQNQPNPFNASSVINYSLKVNSNVLLEISDITGKVIKTVNQGAQAAGKYQIALNANEFAEGIYFYTFTIGEKRVAKRMIITK